MQYSKQMQHYKHVHLLASSAFQCDQWMQTCRRHLTELLNLALRKLLGA